MFVTGDLTFQLRRESEQLVIGISSEESWPDHIESRMIEALQFVLARPLSWLILEKQTQQELQVWVQSHRFDSSTPALQPPLAYAHSEQRIVKSAWDLFDCYLRHIIHRSEPDQHPLSRILSLVREASTGSLHVAALTLGVMVEGILKQEFQHLWRAAEGEKEAWNELAGLVAKLPGPEFVKERTVNFMREAWTPSARACLQALTTAGVITANQLNAWVVLRNSYAHGKLPKIEVLRDLDNLVNKVTVLMYRLIFAAIGYQGPYTDYSAKGWPLSEFTLRALQNEPPELSL